MKILAYIPVELVTGPGWFSFKNEVREVDVIRVIRTPACRDRSLNRWHYSADIADHLDMHPDSIRIGSGNCQRVNIQRKGLNPNFKPPTFEEGSYVFSVQPELIDNMDDDGGSRAETCDY